MNDVDLAPYIEANPPDSTKEFPGSANPMHIWDALPEEAAPEGMRFDYRDDDRTDETGYVLVYVDTCIIFNLVVVE